MALNKRGFVFTGLVLVVISVSIISYVIVHNVTDREEITSRVETLDSFAYATEQDLERQLYIAGFRILFTAQDYITREGKYFDNTNTQLEEMFLNGTLFGNEQILMIGTTFSDMSSTLQERSNKMGLNTTLSYPAIQVDQQDPWHVQLSMKSQLKIEDQNNLAKIAKNITIIVSIPIDNFEDPIYSLESSGTLTNKIRRTLHSVFIQNGNTANLLNHTVSSYYKSSTLAPRFLDRLQGNFSASAQGIESLVNLVKLSAQGGQAQTKSVVDYIYFSENNPSSVQVSGMPSWFRLDTAHLSEYNAA